MRKQFNRVVALLQILLQLTATLLPLSSLAHSSDPPATISTGPGGAQASDGSLAQAMSVAEGVGGASLAGWLNQWGRARVALNIDNHGSWDGSAIDLLTPLWQNPQAMFFAQAGFRAPQGRNTGNIGLGVRRFLDNSWMVGGNVFFDDDFTGNNRRLGFGLEAWRDDIKLSANRYFGTTTWHASADADNYQEKPADGFDVRAQGYLPAYPQLGGKIIYEHYQGDEVALFGKDDRQRNPSAVTLGLSYTPVPLLSLGADYRRGENARDETSFSLALHYQPGMSWAALIDPDNVAAQRTLAGSRTDLVERNNEIVLQYREQRDDSAVATFAMQSLTDNSPADGVASNRIAIRALTTDGAPAANVAVQWRASGHALLTNASSVTDARGVAEASLTDNTPEPVTVEATAGGITHAVVSHFGQGQASLALTMEQNNRPADGISQNLARMKLTDSDGKPRAYVDVTWSVSGDATLHDVAQVTDASGSATATLTSQTPGAVTLRVSADGQQASTTATFVAPQPAGLSLSMIKDNVAADNQSSAQAQARVTDAEGKPLSGVTVQWGIADSRTAQLTTPASVATDSDGIARVSLKDSVAEAVTLNASGQGVTGSVIATFVAVPVGEVNVTVPANNAPADGGSVNEAQAAVTDIHGAPMAGISVTWSLSGDTAHAASPVTVTTDAQGKARLTFTDTMPETLTVTAAAQQKSGSAQARFTAIVAKNVVLSVMRDEAPADNVSLNRVKAKVTDGNGKPINGASVAWSISGSGTAHLTTPAWTTTDANGETTAELKDSVAQPVGVIASADGIATRTTVNFSAP
ncbi:inverse autotransporter beta domain-containing protein [Cronobacter dublinensis]|nr:inverse autotransporter beta domain-containing protein [Cronobacter dublinensis]